jgi:sugar phosphate isomerase/epimerase
MVRDAGMTMGVVRLGVRGADYDRQLDQAAAIGARIVALTTAPIFIASRTLGQTTRAALDAYIPQLAALGEKAKAAGLTLAYHNHWYDLMPIDGDRPLDLMASRIAPDLLSFEIDLAWAWYAGVAPLDLLATLGPRVVSMHLKDIDRNHGTAITDHAVTPGSGEMDYAALMPRIARLTRATGYVEVDNPEDGLAAARAAMAYLRGR